MFCKYCGAKNKDDAKFCASCGKSIDNSADRTIQKKKSLSTLKKIMIPFWSLVAIAVIAFLFLNRNVGSTQTAGSPNYYLQHGDFSVYFPSQPTYSTISQQFVEGGASFSDDVYSLTLPNSVGSLTATYVQSPFTGSNLTPQENLQDELNHTGNSNGFTVTSSNLTAFDGFPAINYVAYNSSLQEYEVGRDVLSSNLYMLDYLYLSGQEDKQTEDAFLDSLKFGQISDTQSVASNIFYTQSATTNVRTCASLSCKSVGTYPANTIFSEPYATLADLPEWIEINWQDNGDEKTGYIKSSTLGEAPVSTSTLEAQARADSSQVDSTQTAISTPKNLPAVIAEWNPHVALILCTYNNGDADFGSGFLTNFSDGSIVVITNNHVITDEATGYGASKCALQIPGDPKTYVEDGSAFRSGSIGDWAFIPVADGDAYFNNTATQNLQICQQQASTGDNVVVLGYPDYAGQFNDPTATEGIISGYAAPYYTTSAQIESGNSGGVAINPDKDCYVGIPSAVKVGNYSNLGRILSADVPFKLPY